MSHAAVDSEVLFWFVVVLTLVLVLFAGAAVRARPEAAGSPQPPGPYFAAPRQSASARQLRRPPDAVPGDAVPGDAVPRPPRAGYRPGNAGAMDPRLMAGGRPRAPGGPPWGPAPRPPGMAYSHAVPPPAMSGQVPVTVGAPGRTPVRVGAPGRTPVAVGAYPALQPGWGLAPHSGGTFGPAGAASSDPGRVQPAPIAAGRARSGGRAGAHRRASRTGARRISTRSGRTRGSAGHVGKHRAGGH